MNFKLFKPEIFQGNLKTKNYFERWYYKHVSRELNNVWSFIPGISLNEKDPHSFIQIINGITGTTEYVRYDVNEFSWRKNKLYIKVGNSVFTDNSVDLNIETGNLKVFGHLEYSNIIRYPGNFFSTGIRGWYSYIPFIRYKHGMVSVNHDISGHISINDDIIKFDGGKGYIEKDWGTSFPEAWLWIQANNFHDWNSSFSFSVAKIPWRGKFFIGFITFLYYNKKFLIFSTYNNSVIRELIHDGNSVELLLKNHHYYLHICTSKNSFGELKASVSEKLSGKIKESIDSKVTLKLFDTNNNLIYTDSSKRAGLEVTEKIFEYVK